MSPKTVLLVDDEPGMMEPLADALEYEGHCVLRATSAEEALSILNGQPVDLATVDVMMPPGASLEDKTTSQEAGVYLLREMRKEYPNLDLLCLSVVGDTDTIRTIQNLGVRFLRKGETPLRTVLAMIHSRLTGIAYSTDRRRRGPSD